ncbi:protein FAM209A isoform X1 [Cebus imitator]|nr:protein FAM209A isoform X1 [Cebus imitator]
MMASPSKAPGLERVPWQGIGTHYAPPLSLTVYWKCPHLPLSPPPGLPRSLIILCPEIITMARLASAQGLCDITKGLAPGAQSSSCKSKQTHHEQFPSPSLLTMWMLKWFLVLLLCLIYSYAFMFSPLREKTNEPQGKVPYEGHFRIRQSPAEHTQGWLGNKWLWLLFVVVLYVILKCRGGSGKKKEPNPPGLRGSQFRTPLKKSQNASPNKDCAFNTLNQLEVELVKFVSKVRNLKVAMATGGGSNLRLRRSEMPADPHNNITIYEIWGEGGSN